MSTDQRGVPGPVDGPTGGMAREAASGVAWTLSQQWLLRIFGFVTVALLARLLAPEDFGLVAIGLTLLPLVQLLADLGFSTYLVQADRPARATYNTAFWYSTTVGSLLCGALVLVAPLVADLFGVPEAATVIRSLAPTACLVALGAVPLAILRRELRFRRIAVQAAVAGVSGQLVAIVLAVTGFGFWALVWQTIVVQTVILVLCWRAVSWRPGLEFSWREFTVMARFGVSVIGASLVSQSRLWLENVIVTYFLGVGGLGYLNIAQRLVLIAHDLTTNAVAPVSVVVFARIRDTAERLLAGYLRAQFLAHTLVVPVMLVLAIGAGDIFPLFFGSQWEVSVGPGQVLAIAGIFTMSGIDQGLLLGAGRPGAWLAWVVVVDAATVLTTLSLAARGLSAVALGFLGVAVVGTAVRWFVVGHVLGTRWWTVASPLVRVLPAAAGAAAAGLLAREVTRSLPALPSVALVGLAVAAFYVPLVRWTLPSVWEDLLRFGRPWVARLRPHRQVAVR